MTITFLKPYKGLVKLVKGPEIGEDATHLHHNHATSITLVSTHHLIISYSSRVVLSLFSPCRLEFGVVPIVTRWMSNKLV